MEKEKNKNTISDYKNTKEFANSRLFWINKLRNLSESTKLQFCNNEINNNSSGNNLYRIEICQEISNKLLNKCKNSDLATFIYLNTCLNILINRYNLVNDIVIITPTLINKGATNTDNEILIRSIISETMTFRDALGIVKKNVLEAYKNQEFDINNLYKDSIIDPGDFSVEDNIACSFNNIHTVKESNSKLHFNFNRKDSVLEIEINYDQSRFRRNQIERISIHFSNIIAAVIDNPDINISEIDIFDEEEKNNLLFELFNSTKVEVEREKCFQSILDNIAEKNSDKIAVVEEDKSITYKVLTSNANQLANQLLSIGVKRGDLISISCEPSIEFLIAVIAVFKVGAAYIPIDVSFPEERKRTILSDAGSNVFLTKSNAFNPDNASISEFEVETNVKNIIFLNEIKESDKSTKFNEIKIHEISFNSNEVSLISNQESNQNDLSYIIYTSGTTGNPKGAQIQHKGMVNHLYAKINDLSVTGGDVIAQSSSISFDISVWQFLAALLVGGSVVIIKKEIIYQPKVLLEEIQKKGISIFETVPTLISAIIENTEENQNRNLKNLRWMIPTGETLSVSLARKWYEIYPDITLVNAYGPTEASDDVTHHFVNREKLENKTSVPIGIPIQNTHIYILNSEMKLCPVGIKGEICVAGIGVGKGYLNNKNKTSNSFVHNPYNELINDTDYSLIYKTGDYGYINNDNLLECLGRMDYQVKIRGNRIELGEIESTINRYKDIQDVVVIDEKINNATSLIAFYVKTKDSNENFTIGELKEYLKKYLPEYMIPSFFKELSEIPLSANGKKDRKQLVNYQFDFSENIEIIDPTNNTEALIVEIFKDVLKLNEVSIETDFFDLGGDSILLLTLLSKLNNKFDIELALNNILGKTSPKILAELISHNLFAIKENSNYIEYNKGAEKKIFCFPPIPGFSYWCSEIANNINEYSFVSFNFIESDGRIDEYVETILNLNDNQPIILLGHSSGGGLAFEVAKALESKGAIVSDIIMGDNFRRVKQIEHEVTKEEILGLNVFKYIKDSKLEYLNDKVFGIISKYFEYINKHINSGVTNANIRMLIGDDRKMNPLYASEWIESTSNSYLTYKCTGNHNDLFNKFNRDANINIIRSILEDIIKSSINNL